MAKKLTKKQREDYLTYLYNTKQSEHEDLTYKLQELSSLEDGEVIIHEIKIVKSNKKDSKLEDLRIKLKKELEG